MQKVTDPALLAELNGGAQAPAAQPRQAPQGRPGIPQMVVAPKPKAPPPPPSGYEIAPGGGLRPIRGGPADTGAEGGPIAKAREGEANNLAYLGRAESALNEYNAAEKELGGPRSTFGGILAAIPGGQTLLRELPDDIGDSPTRRAAERAKIDFATNILRSDSGANAPEPEVARLVGVYFPPAGETDPAVLESYRVAREKALEGVRAKSGRLGVGTQGERKGDADKDEAAAAARRAGGEYRPDVDEIALGMDLPGSQTSNVTGARIPPQIEAELAAYLQARLGDENFDPAEYQAYARSRGVEGTLTLAPELVEAVRKGEPLPTGIDYSSGDTAARARAEAELERRLDGSEISATPSIDKGVTLNLSDELYGIRGGLGELLTGGNFQEGYELERDVERLAQQRAREEYGVGPEIAGSFLLPGGALTKAKTVGQFAKQGAALGTLAGFGEGEGPTDSLEKAIAGTVIGGTLGGTLGAGSKALQTPTGQKIVEGGKRLLKRNKQPVDVDVVRAGERQGIPIRQPDARPGTRNAFAVTEASPTQGQRVRQTLDEDEALVEQRLGEIGGEGTVLSDSASMGERLQGAAKRSIAKSGQQANALYERAKQLGGDTVVGPERALAAIDDHIADLAARGQTSNAGQIRYLQGIRDDITRDGLTIDNLRSLRTDMRGQINERNLTATDAERRVGDIARAASVDIERALSSNPNALGAYKAADDFYRQKQDFIKDVAQRFLGPRNSPLSAEQAATRFRAMVKDKGDFQRFSRMMKQLDPEEHADVTATMAQGLGRTPNGEFSLDALSKNIRNLSRQAKREIFGEDGGKALEDLDIIARAKADTQRGLNNSKSGVVSAGRNRAADVILGALGGTIGGSAAGGAGAVPGAIAGMMARGALERFSDARSARLLLNPNFTKWLREFPPEPTPDVINRHFDRLNKLAAREQAFLMDAQALQDYLRRHLSEGVGRAAATGENGQDNGREKPR